MKHPFRKLLSVLLPVAMLAALLPAVHAAQPSDLRYVVANHTKALAGMEWKMENRTRPANYSVEKKTILHQAGVMPTYYYEYDRLYIPYVGAIVSEHSATYEQIKAELTGEGFLPENVDADYLGMNPDAFLVDVVSRVSPTPITGVKQAITSGALTPLVSGVNTSAASSKLAVSNTSALNTAYGKLAVGDLLIAWDDNATQGSAPTTHVLVVSDTNVDGSVYVTYPAFAQPTFHFTCSSCGYQSSEGPTADVAPKHVLSSNYQFSRYYTHAEVDPTSNCSGTFRPNGATTWRTEKIDRNKLLGTTTFSGGGVRYIPYTLPVYSSGAPDANVTLDTQTTANTLAAGFEGTITSNYRITQVDAVLSTANNPDQMFTHYPDYDTWTYDFKDDALNVALVAASAGSCSLTLNVHSGPILDTGNMDTPVTKAFSASILLGDPSFELVSNTTVAHQGQSVWLGIKPIEDGITATRMELTYDRDTYAFDLAKTRSANKNVTFAETADGSVSITYSGTALTRDAVMANLYFTPHRTGALPIPAEQTGSFAVRTAWKATSSNPDMVPARFGGDPITFTVGYNIKIFDNYAAGKSLILLASEGFPTNATYDGRRMLDVTDAHYALDGRVFSHTYAVVVDHVNLDLISATQISASYSSISSYLLYYDGDVNLSGNVDIRDAQSIANIMAGRLPLDGNQKKWLLADMDANGKVDSNDILSILNTANR